MFKGKDREIIKNLEEEMIIHLVEDHQETEEVIEITMETEDRIEVEIVVTIGLTVIVETPATIEIAEITGGIVEIPEKNDSEMIVKMYYNIISSTLIIFYSFINVKQQNKALKWLA